jgi:hypothetical protein
MPDLAKATAGLNVSTALEAGSSYHAAADAANGLLIAAAWKHDPVRLGGWAVTPSRPSLFVLRRWPNGTISASASVPDGVGTLTLVVGAASQVLRGSEAPGSVTQAHRGSSISCVLHFDLPSGDSLGMSTKAACTPWSSLPVASGS